jgi:hypothetical protein
MVANLTVARSNAERQLVAKGPITRDANGNQVQAPSYLEQLMQLAKVKYKPDVPAYEAMLHQGLALNNNQAVYRFSFAENDIQAAPSYPTHSLLRLQDAFLCTGFAIHLSKRDSTASAVGKEILASYPNPNATTGFGASADDLEVVYNGQLSLQINKTTAFENYRLHVCRAVPTSQTGVGAAQAMYLDGYNEDMVRQDFVRPFLLLGNLDNTFTIQIPANNTIAGTAPISHVLEFTLYGFLVPGVLNQR